MAVDLILVITLTTLIQSMFGVGVLLFGTPALLLLGYDFIPALVILLPISVTINLLQILKHHVHTDLNFVKDVLRFTIPGVVVFLFIASSGIINITFLVGAFLIFIALKSVAKPARDTLNWLINHESLYLMVMGVIHGLTNLGGSLLTAIVHGKNYPKDRTRVTIALCYAMLACFQLVTLTWLGEIKSVPYSDTISLLQWAVVVFLITEEMVYRQLDNHKYQMIFTVFLLASGLLLLWKSLST
ncbi:MAG: TSUP family transporter [Methylococcales bacterium]|nr:TSUP family transporter [Methylococcales bacterium]